MHSRLTFSRSAGEQVVTFDVQSPSLMVTEPRTTGLSPFTARKRVDLPEPERPINTRISPFATVSEQSWTPRIWPVFVWISDRLRPSSIRGRARSG